MGLRVSERGTAGGWACQSISASWVKKRSIASCIVQILRPIRTYSRRPLRHHRQSVHTDTFLPSILGRSPAAWVSMISGWSGLILAFVLSAAFAMLPNVSGPAVRLCAVAVTQCAAVVQPVTQSLRQ